MKTRVRLGLLAAAILVPIILAQPPDGPPDKGGEPNKGGFGKFGFGPPGGQQRKVLAKYDKDGNGLLDKEERTAAREGMKKDGAGKMMGRGGFGKGGFGKGGDAPTPKPGPKVRPADVKNFPDSALFEPGVLRTLFLEFDESDWEKELEEFHGTDVEVSCTLRVDGKVYTNVGVHFRGMSSYMGVSAGSKRSMNLSLDYDDGKQRLYGAKTVNLLNSHDDESMLGSVLFSHVARQYIPAPKANFVRVVINGESWGVYVNAQQFNKEFAAEHFKSTKGARWKVRGSPGGAGGLDYIGDKIDDYKRRYEIKSNDDEKSWKALIALCKTIKETPPEKLEAALNPILDIEGVLWFLALDVALINGDGYWIRASDYSILRDDKGVFHVVPHDMNEAFRPPGGPGFGGGGFMMMPRPGDVMPMPLQFMLQLDDEQKKKVAEVQKDVDAQLAKILTPVQAKKFKEPGDRVIVGGPGGPGGGMGKGPGGGRPAVKGVELDPLVGLTDAAKPLRSKLLAVPALRARYLEKIRIIARDSLDWNKLGPVVARYRELIQKDVEADTRKLDSYEGFLRATADAPPTPAADAPRRMGAMNLRAFADQRRKYLLEYQEPKQDAK